MEGFKLARSVTRREFREARTTHEKKRGDRDKCRAQNLTAACVLAYKALNQPTDKVEKRATPKTKLRITLHERKAGFRFNLQC